MGSLSIEDWEGEGEILIVESRCHFEKVEECWMAAGGDWRLLRCTVGGKEEVLIRGTSGRDLRNLDEILTT